MRFLFPWLAFAALFILLPTIAVAGPLTDLVEAVAPGLTAMGWWGELVTSVVAVAALVAAALPQGTNGPLRRLLDWIALNVGNAENR